MADKIQSFAGRKDMKKFFDAHKTVYGPQSSGTTPLLSADGTNLLTDKEAILKRWAEHFDLSSVGQHLSMMQLSTAYHRWNVIRCLMGSQPSETVKAIKLLSSGNVSRSDVTPAEIYKVEGPPVAENLTELFQINWRKEAITKKFRDAIIIHLFKRKGNLQVCDSHRGVSLLSVAGKILARVQLNWLNEYLEQSGILPEIQCGFRKDRKTIGMIFTARQLQEKCHKQYLNMTFVDLPKHDTVNREGLSNIMAKFGCPAKFIAIVRQFHNSMLARVQNDCEFSDPFPVTNDVE